MRKLLLAALLVLVHHIVVAQVQIGSAEMPAMGRAGSLSDEDLAAFKQTTTLFTLQTGDYDRKEDFEAAIRRVWTITPFRIITPDKISDYMNSTQYSFATFGGYMIQRNNAVNTHLSYDIWMPKLKKDGTFKSQLYFARIALSPSFETYKGTYDAFYGRKGEQRAMNYIYNESRFYNWQPGFLVAYLKTTNDYLLRGERRGIFDAKKEKDALQVLKRETLYVPSYTKVHFNMFSGNEKDDSEKDESDLKDDYPFPVQYLDAAEISRRILNSKETVYFLVYVKSSTDKYVSVYASDGRELYTTYSPMSYNFKNKDMRRVKDTIQ